MSKQKLSVSFSVLLVALLSFVAVPTFAASSNVNGVVKGEVIDDAGNGINAVSVTISNPATGLKRTVSTDNGGHFQLQLPPGNYVLNGNKNGYQSILVESVSVSIGDTAHLSIPITETAIEEIVTYSSASTLIQKGTAESAMNISLDEISQLPIPRDVESVALMAPDTILGDNSFGVDFKVVSFGGASVAENAYFIDGLNVTNFRNGMGGSSVPFEFYDQFQIKSGGYSAEFGRSIGGVINAVTKRGTNDFKYGVVSYFEPSGGYSKSPNTRFNDGSFYDFNEENKASKSVIDVYVSGPIIKDRLFFYALYEPADTQTEFASLNAPEEFNLRETNEDFWGGNLTWNITDAHSVSVTAFSDERERVTDTYDYDADTKARGDFVGSASDFRGGDNVIARYDGQITDNFVVSALYGKNKYDLTTNSTNDLSCPLVVDARSGRPGSSRPGCEVASVVDSGGDEREAYRFDVEYYWGDHTFRAGLDNEDNSSTAASQYSGFDTWGLADGGIYYRYETNIVGASMSNDWIMLDENGDGSPVDTVRVRYHDNGGDFQTESKAYYLEDVWDINNNLTLSAGIRNETFKNYNSDGDLFIEVKNQWAPRFGLSWSPTGDAEKRVYASWGRYHIPIASNTNVRLSGAELDFQDYYLYDGNRDPETAAPVAIDANGVPTTTKLGGQVVNADGTIPDTRTVLDQNLDPMYQDEYIIGYEQQLGDDWIGGIRYVHRDLGVAIDDILTPCGNYILTNPGIDADTFDDCNPAGEIQAVHYTAEELGFPEAEREYDAVELSIEKVWGDGWRFNGSYTWSKSKGNTEGLVKSDNGQDDAGITQDFDIPELMDGAYGALPNDRKHKLKMYGTYTVTDNLVLGATYYANSGRPRNAFGAGHPNGTPQYGDTFYLGDPDDATVFTKVPRGTFGRTNWVHNINLSAIYSMNLGNADVELRAEVFNLFNMDSAIEVNEFAEDGPGSPAREFGRNQYYQTPRYLRFGASIRF